MGDRQHPVRHAVLSLDDWCHLLTSRHDVDRGVTCHSVPDQRYGKRPPFLFNLQTARLIVLASLGQQLALTVAAYTTFKMARKFAAISTTDTRPWAESLTFGTFNYWGVNVNLTPSKV
jgi:hypothetical protein